MDEKMRILKMVEEGTPEEVIWHPKHPYTKLLVDSVL